MKIRVIDYVFYRGDNIRVTGYLGLPKCDKIDQDIGNPAVNHPSDHYAIAFKYEIWFILQGVINSTIIMLV